MPLLALDDPVTGPVAHGRARYPIDSGVGVLASNGLGFPITEFESFVSRTRTGQLRTGRAALRGSRATLTGPLARNALCARLLHPAARGAADRAKLTADERNPYRSALIRAVELVHALEEAEALIEHYEPADPPPRRSTTEPGQGRGSCATESPSGLLYQRYDLKPDGTVGTARLIGPDELNRTAVELDLRRTERTARHHDPAIDLARLAEMRTVLANNYEPCAPGSFLAER
jgi:coenzyme F420-reducing hydrogenase alpha subunit